MVVFISSIPYFVIASPSACLTVGRAGRYLVTLLSPPLMGGD